jgi:hypothetical protein
MPATLFPANPSSLVWLDCSAFATLVYKAPGAPDPNRFGYNGYGKTSTLMADGHRTSDPHPGDLVLYRSPQQVGVFIGNNLEQSTSASALLLSSIDAARRQFQRDGEELLGAALERARRLRTAIEGLDGLDLMGEDVIGGPGAFAFDPTHVTFDVTGLGLRASPLPTGCARTSASSSSSRTIAGSWRS